MTPALRLATLLNEPAIRAALEAPLVSVREVPALAEHSDLYGQASALNLIHYVVGERKA
jgi:hypothetical protein